MTANSTDDSSQDEGFMLNGYTPHPDRRMATTLLRGQFVEHQNDTPVQWTAWRDNLPFRWAQALVDQWRAEAGQR